MKIGKIALIAVALFIVTGATHAQRETVAWGERFTYTTDGERFLPQEFTFDVFGSWLRGHDDVDDFFTDDHDDGWGGGLGVNFFFTKFLGVGASAAVHDNRGAFVDHVVGDAILRFPIEPISTAPYIFGGGGRVFDPSDKWEAHVGAGIEFRLNPHTGIFSDGRFMWVEGGDDRSQVRFGLRFAY